jgi:hypothetical protein
MQHHKHKGKYIDISNKISTERILKFNSQRQYQGRWRNLKLLAGKQRKQINTETNEPKTTPIPLKGTVLKEVQTLWWLQKDIKSVIIHMIK